MATTMDLPYDLDNVDEDMSYAQIDELLQNAERRLKAPQADSAPKIEKLSSHNNPRLRNGKVAEPYVTTAQGVAHLDTSRALSGKDRQLAGKVRVVEDPIKLKERVAKEKKATAGSDWFNLPRTNLTPELKQDLQLLKMRNVLDPKRHYKKDNSKSKVPTFSQVGTIIEGPTEFYSSRIPNKERKKTFVEEVLAAEDSTGRFKSKYSDIQSTKTSGKKAYYKKLKDKRNGDPRKR